MKKWLLIVLVLAVIVLLCIMIPSVRKVILAPADMIEAVSTGMEIKQLEAMIFGFKKGYERWPSEDEFHNMVEKAYKKDRADSLKYEGLVDLWGEPYNYFRQGSGFIITSMGPDKKPGTTDDIILLRRN